MSRHTQMYRSPLERLESAREAVDMLQRSSARYGAEAIIDTVCAAIYLADRAKVEYKLGWIAAEQMVEDIRELVELMIEPRVGILAERIAQAFAETYGPAVRRGGIDHSVPRGDRD